MGWVVVRFVSVNRFIELQNVAMGIAITSVVGTALQNSNQTPCGCLAHNHKLFMLTREFELRSIKN